MRSLAVRMLLIQLSFWLSFSGVSPIDSASSILVNRLFVRFVRATSEGALMLDLANSS